jgi:DNA-binding CsgD family transcriptional regulator
MLLLFYTFRRDARLEEERNVRRKGWRLDTTAEHFSKTLRGAQSDTDVPAKQGVEVIWGDHVQLYQAAVNCRKLTQASASPSATRCPLVEPLTSTEMRVLQYLPTYLSMAQIASELYVSLNTIRTHMRHVYAKLGTHGRAETVDRARELGLVAPSAHLR